MSLRAAVLWVLLLLPLVGRGGLAPGEMPAFRRFSGREGLPQSQVCSLLEDRNGFLWVGTYGGVARMGALGFQTFGGIPGLKGSRAWALLEAPDGAVWVAFQDGGLVRIEGNQFRIFGPKDGLTEVDSYSLAWDEREQRVLVGTREGLFEGKEGRFRRLELPSGWTLNPIFALVMDPSGGVWLGSRGGKLALWKDGGIHPAELPAEFRNWAVEGLSRDGEGNLWAMGTQGLALRRPGQGWERVMLEGTRGQVRLRGLHVGGNGDVLVSLGTDGLWIRSRDGRQRLLGIADGLPAEGLFSALRDRSGRLWVGTNGGGLGVQGIPGLVNFRTALGHEVGDILAFAEPTPGVVLVGGGQGMFRWVEGRGFVGHWGPKEGLPGPEVWAFQPDGRGGIWVGTDKGVAYWKDGRVRPAPSPLNQAVIHHFLKDGDHFLGGSDEGLIRFDQEGHQLATHTLPPEAIRPTIYSLETSSHGLLVGTMHGVMRFQDGRFQPIWTDAPFAQQRITVLHEDLAKRMWVATTKGLYTQRQGQWVALGRETGLPDELIYFVGDARDGRVAVGHGKGVTILSQDRLLNLNLNLGLISDETNQGGYFEDSRGRLWIGQIGGLSRVDGTQLAQEDPTPRPVLVEAAWSGGHQALPATIQVPPRTFSLDLRVDSGTPLVAIPPTLQVQLKGMDPDWRTVEGGHLQYGQLPPGTYSIHLRASSDGSVWTYAAPVELVVAAAWHEHVVGRILIGLAVVGVVAGAVALRIRALNQARVALEERIRERTAALAESEQAAHAASRAKSTFLANMSHELRTPLNAVLGFTQLMAREPGQSRQNKEHLDRIMRAGEHLLGLINDVLSISKIEAGHLVLSLGAFDLSLLLKSVAEMAEVRARSKGISFTLTVEGGLPEVVEGDEGKLRQVLLNLVGNALKFTSEGEVALRVYYRAGSARFEVVDTGPGISQAEQGRLFEAFHQADLGRRHLEGTGLGLHIGQAMVRLMGGHISLDSQVGRGTTFAFTIPLPPSGKPGSRHTRRKVIGLADGQAPLRILAVDDREENRIILGRLFRMLGCEVMEAEDGVDALGHWERAKPDVIWLDIRMPRMDGFETIQRLRELEQSRGLPRTTVIALTASAFDHDLEAMVKAGFDGQVVKPFREEDLFEALERLMGVRFLREEEDPAEPRPAAPGLDTEALAAQPEAWRQAFRRAVQLGDSAESLALVAGVADANLAGQLRALIQAYRFEDLSDALGAEP